MRVRELIEPLGFDGGKTIVDDYLREVRPMFVTAADVSADGLSAGRGLPVGSVGAARRRCRSVTARPRRAWVVVACLGYSRAGAGALVFSKEAPDVLWGMTPLPVVVGRAAGADGVGPRGVPARRRRPADRGAMRRSAGSCRSAGTSASRADPQAKGAVERLQGYMETNFEPGRRFANQLDFQLQLDAWFEKANARTHKTLRARPIDRLRRGARGDAAAARARA